MEVRRNYEEKNYVLPSQGRIVTARVILKIFAIFNYMHNNYALNYMHIKCYVSYS